MPGYVTPLRVGSSSVKLVKDGVDYPLDIDSAGFTRVGEDGSIKMLSLFGGDEGVGEVLEGHWRKGWDAGMDAAQAFTAILDGSGTLEFEGEADVAGTWGYGWINSQLPLPLLDETEVTVAMSVPVDDTGGTANRDILLDFYLRREKAVDTPRNDDDYIRIWADIDETGIIFYITKEVRNSTTLLFSGSTYDAASVRATGDLEATIWRLVFHGKPGTSGAHVHVYLKQSDTLANAENSVEHELTTSPYDINDLMFHIAYSAFRIGSQNTSYFDAGDEAKVGYVRVDYPDHEPRQMAADGDLFDNQCELWDGDPDSGGIQVKDEDHEFTNDPYIQNGLIRVHIDEGIIEGLKLSWYSGASYTNVGYFKIYNQTYAKFNTYPYHVKIIKVSPEKIIIRVKLTESAVDNDDYYTLLTLSMTRGKQDIKIYDLSIYPAGQFRTYIRHTTKARFGYGGNCKIGDADILNTGTNSTMSDNFLIAFDDDGQQNLYSMNVNEEPKLNFNASAGGYLYIARYLPSTAATLIVNVSITPFSHKAELFEEAEDGSYGAAGTVTDAAASPPAGPNNAVQLNAIGNYTVPNGEYSAYVFTAGTHLPAGRYIAAIRARYVDIETMEMYVYNSSDSEYRNEKNAKATKTLAATYGYHCIVFDITDADVTGTDTIAIVAEKTNNNTDEIRTDYALVIPIGDGESWPQDLAHSALRSIELDRRVTEK